VKIICFPFLNVKKNFTKLDEAFAGWFAKIIGLETELPEVKE